MVGRFFSHWKWMIGLVAVFVVVQIAISLGLLTTYWATVVQRACIMAIVSLGLNLIYGFNGQFSLGQWGFYAIGAYSAADITYRWAQGDMAGLAAATAHRGVATGLVSVPNRYMHSPNEMVDLGDLERAAALLAAFARRVTPATDFTPR